jgi:hypothetical protein
MRVTIVTGWVCLRVVIKYSIYTCLQAFGHRVEQRSNRSDVTVRLTRGKPSRYSMHTERLLYAYESGHIGRDYLSLRAESSLLILGASLSSVE